MGSGNAGNECKTRRWPWAKPISAAFGPEREDSAVSDMASDAAGDAKRPRANQKASGAKPVHGTIRSSGGMRIYKPGQGFYTRIGTAIGAGVLAVAGAVWLFGELEALMDRQWAGFLYVQYGVSVGFLAVMALLIYWVVGLSAKTNDFFIATEGEMKKVNWSTRREVIRSTKVVIVTVVLLAIILFLVDLLFLTFFYAIDVIKVPVSVLKLIGLGS